VIARPIGRPARERSGVHHLPAATARLAIAALAVVALAACGSGSTASAAAAVKTTSVNLPPSYKFDPPSIEVTAGSTVTWTNNDNFTHSVQFLDGGLPTDPMMMNPGGATATFTFSQPGTFHYQCSLHPQNMKGTVTVTS